MLTLVTAGFYTPWARVRTRRYFHANTHLDGHAFDYLAKPINILWGYLLILAFLGLYQLGVFYDPMFLIVFFAIYVLLGPWIVYKAMRFKAHNTSYRNVRFQFHGTIGDAYAIYLGMAILIPLTFGFIVPYWIMKQKEYFYKNLSFGGRQFDFTPQAGEYYVRYIISGVLMVGIYIAYFIIMGALAVTLGGSFGSAVAVNGPSETGDLEMGSVIGAYMLFVPLMAGILFVQIYVYVSIFNYNLSRMLVQQSSFESKLKVGRFYWITLTNIIASVASLGLLVPWAAIRKTRYLAESVEVEHPGTDLGDFVAGREGDVSAVGDAAADIFEFEIGW